MDSTIKEPSGAMRVLEARVYRGPNVYGYYPMIRFKLDLGATEAYPTNLLPGFTEALLKLMPSLYEHGCSYQEAGGLVRRMQDGTWLGHVTEHVALELQTLAGTPVTYGKTRSTGEREGIYNVMYSYREERVGLLAAWLALRVVQSLLPVYLQGLEGLNLLVPRNTEPLVEPHASFDFTRELEALILVAERLALGPTTRSLVAEAERRGIPAFRLDDESLVQLGYGKYQTRIRASVTSKTPQLAVEIAKDKSLTNRLLAEVGLPVPEGVVVGSVEAAIKEAEVLGFPVVTKPYNGNHGRGVSVNLYSPEQVRWGFEQAQRHSSEVMVERFFPGRDYRILVVNDEVVAVAERVPAHVIGDGKHSVRQLIDFVNQDPQRGLGHEKVLTRISVDASVERLLAQSGRSLATVPAQGVVIVLRTAANLSTGGTAIDCTDVIHPENAEIARLAARVVGLDVAGIDMVTPDITRSVREWGGGIVEINAGPGFRMHLQPSEGKARNVAAPVIDGLFPQGVPCRIPIVAITGTNGKTTTSRMVAHILKSYGLRTGLTTTGGIYIDDKLYLKGDTTGPRSARMVLCDPTVEAAVLETARGGILREGLAFRRCDVGAVLNIQADHLGLKGVETLEDLAWVKSLVVEVVEDNGYSILNADDPLSFGMYKRANGQVVLFSMQGGDSCAEHVRKHIAEGGVAVVRQPGPASDLIVIYDDKECLPLMLTHEIPATLKGLARVNVENALAAAAIGYALGVPIETIRSALGSFSNSYAQSPGRLNFHEDHSFRVLVDYAHNPAGMRHLVNLVAALRPEHGCVIGVVGVAGDRRNEDIHHMGELAAEMVDELIVREDDDQRGRPRGDATRLIVSGAYHAGLPPERVTVIMDEAQAVERALQMALPDDLVILLVTDIERTWQQVQTFKSSHQVGPLQDSALGAHRAG